MGFMVVIHNQVDSLHVDIDGAARWEFVEQQTAHLMVRLQKKKKRRNQSLRIPFRVQPQRLKALLPGSTLKGPTYQ